MEKKLRSGATADPRTDITEVEFAQKECITYSEVAAYLRSRKESGGADLPNVVDASLAYVERFGKFKSKEAVQGLRNALESVGLREYEIVMLANLCPVTVTEAKTLIPTLSPRLDDDQIETILADLIRFKNLS